METISNASEMSRTLKESRPKAYAGLEMLYRAASDVISDPQYERVAPAPESETLNTWGIEMFYYGITLGYKLARAHMREESLSLASETNSQTVGDWGGADGGSEG